MKPKKSLLIQAFLMCSLLFAIPSFTAGQSCSWIVLYTQTEVDQFAVDYATCSSIGVLEIYSSPGEPDQVVDLSTLTFPGTINELHIYADVNTPLNLSGLSVLTELPGGLEIFNVADYTGLENLQSVGWMHISYEGNDPTFNLDGFSGLTSVGMMDLHINNPEANLIDVFPSLTSAEDIYIGSGLVGPAFFPTYLSSLTGFENIEFLSSFNIGDPLGEDVAIDNLGILNNLVTCGTFTIDWLTCVEFNSFQNLQSTGITDFLIITQAPIEFPALTFIDGLTLWIFGSEYSGIQFPVLEEVNGLYLALDAATDYQFVDMPALTAVQGTMEIVNFNNLGGTLTFNFPLLDTIGGDFIIHYTTLEDLSAFPALNYIGGNVDISDNLYLSNCSLDVFCEKIAAEPENVTIINNSGECSIEGVLNSCGDMYITGTVFADLNCDGIFDPEDVPMPYPLILDASNTSIGYSSENGNYVLFAEQNTEYTLHAAPIPGLLLSSTITVTTGNTNQAYTDQHIALCPIEGYSDLSISLMSGFIRPGFTNTYHVIIQNNSGNAENASASLDLSLFSLMNVVTSTVPFTSDAAGVTFDPVVVDPYSSVTIQLTILLQPGVALGTLNNADAEVSGLNNDATPEDNTFTLVQTVIGSYDPNDINVDKTALEFPTLNPSGEWLTYQIRFQNTGTFAAEFVRVNNVQDENLDLTTLQMIATSHDCQLSFTGNEVSWFFENIQLPDSASDPEGSQGFILFRIRLRTNVELTDLVESTAAIYFDYNEPVITNTALTSFYVCPEALNITGPQEACAGEVLAFNATDEYTTYSWTINGETSASGSSIVLPANTSTIISLHATIGLCAADAETNLIVHPIPATPIISELETACEGEIVTLSVDQVYPEYRWYLNDALIASSPAVELTAQIPFEVKIEVNDAFCSAENYSSLVVLPLPAQPEILGPQAACLNAPVVFSTPPQTNTDYTWIVNGNNLYNGESIELDATEVLSIQLIAAEGNCSSQSSTLLDILPLPTLPQYNGPVSACSGELVTLEITEAFESYEWFVNGTSVSSDATYSFVAEATFPIELHVMNNTCTSASSSIFEVYAFPETPGISGPVELCTGETASFQSTATNVQYAWYYQGEWLGDGSEVEINPLTSGNIELFVSNGPCTANVSQSVTVIQTPDAPSIQGPESICPGEAANYSTTGEYDTYVWSFENLTEVTANEFSLIPENSGYIHLTVYNGTCSSSSNVWLEVNEGASAPVIDMPTAICQGSSITLSTAGSYTSYTWYLNDTMIGTESSVEIEASNSGDVHLVVNNGNCSNESYEFLEVTSPPDAPSIQGPGTVCAGDLVSFNTLSTNNNMQWYFNDETIGNSETIEFVASTSGSVSLEVSNEACSASSSINLIVNALPETPVITQTGNTLTATGEGYFIWTYQGEVIDDHDASINLIGSGSYGVSVESNGCSSALTEGNFVFIGVDEAQMSELVLYPNPATDKLSVRTAEPWIRELRIHDMQGREIRRMITQEQSAFDLDLRELAEGAYTLELLNQERREVRMWVKTR